MTLFLFDIDGTLVTTNGAGRSAMAAAADDLFGTPEVFEKISFAGSLDSRIVVEALTLSGVSPSPRRIARFRSRYLRHLRRRMKPRPGRVMPGVVRALELLRPHARLGLLTGNWREGARVKLESHGIWKHFAIGTSAFGGDAMERGELLRVAYQRALRSGAPSHIVVIGDTPADVACARTPLSVPGVRVTAVAVATGFAEREALVRAEPDLLFDDLEGGMDRLLALVR